MIIIIIVIFIPAPTLQYEGGGSRSSVTDIICPMYKYPDWCIKEAQTDPKKRPVILCEYAHAMGKQEENMSMKMSRGMVES